MNFIRSKFSWRFFIFTIVAVLITRMPVIGDYASIINTLIHESGHALVALFGGEVHHISLFANTEGVTYTRHSNWFGGVFTGAAGYVFSSFMAFIAFWLLGKKKDKVLILILLGFIILNLVFWVRNAYGIFWLISFGAGFAFLLKKGSPSLIQNVLLLIASVMLVESVTSAFEIMLLSFMSPLAAGDAANLAASTLLPAQLFGIIFVVQALLFCYLSIKKGVFKLNSH
ncbi:M50 family metallopeptidase [Bacillus infantis]|uniref:M50 family metallopeptidase n=1 Tax=Bacillus infantis TaxID=324767 RepID=A0A5D4R8N7_9BACI|nr:M50 family metallopeptidase [Bacillus infantis]TYS47745.1 M50 family metallopeptidase [Bacillus infantis]